MPLEKGNFVTNWKTISLTLILLLVATPSGAATRLVSPAIFAKAMKVHLCEQPSSWHVRGSLYQGGLGWTAANWKRFRAKSFPANAADATPQQQAWALAHFLGFYHLPWPDQNYPMSCSGGY